MSSGPVWPNLFVIGAPRAGSTAVYFYLQQHPEVYMTPAKEPGFFAIGGELFDLEHRHTATPAYFLTTIESYQALFRHRTVESVIGDASPQYLFHPRAALRIRHYSRDAKIVAILRSPAARMYSHYMMGVRDGGQHGTFESAVQEAREKHPTPPLLANSYYYDALRLYCYLFPPDQLRVILYDDLSANATMVMQSLYRFLDVDHRFAPDTSVRPNRSGVPKSRIVHTMVMSSLDHRLMRWIHLRGPLDLGQRLEALRNHYFERWVEPQPLSRPAEIALNNDLFCDDIVQLQSLVGHDLSRWLEVEP